jgi:hypothetical protein
MRYGNRNRTTATHTANTTSRPTFMSRFHRRPAYAEGSSTTRRDHRAGVKDGHHAGGMHFGTHGGTTAPVHYHKRHVTLGDKISGAMMKLRGSLTRRPGVKARFEH